MIVGLQTKEANVHFIFGGIYAKALEEFFKFRAEGDDHEAALIKTVKSAMIQSWDAENHCPKPFIHASKSRENLIRTIVWYLEQYGHETEDGLKTYHLQNGKPAVELSFTIELSDDILYCGHLDRVSSMGDRLYILDQKTTGGAVGKYFFDGFKPGNQMAGYTFAGERVLHSPISGVIIDAAQISVNFTEFERGIVTFSKDEIHEWLQNTKYTISLARSATELNYFPMNTTACGNYGGCPFRPICSTTPRFRDNIIKSQYASHNWDPLVER